MKEPDIYNYVWSVVKKYGFKKHNSRIFHLNDRYEITVSRGRQVGNKEFEFEFSDMTKRELGYNWGGYISTMKLDKSYNEKIIYSTFDAWLSGVFQIDELQLYMRSLKIKKLKEKI